MHRYRPPNRHILRYPSNIQQQSRLTPREIQWRLKWPYVLTLVVATLMLILTLVIFSLEIASLSIDSSNNLSNTASTGAGIWCSLSFIIAIIFMYLLVLVYDNSHTLAVCSLIANIIALSFICILIGLDANAITPYNDMISTAPIKVQILKAQLAVAIIMFLFPLSFFAVYIYTAYMSLLPLRVYKNSAHIHIPHSATYVKY